MIENDDKCYHVRDALDISLKCRIPVVYDNLHHQANPTPDKGSESDWIAECAKTWQAEDAIQKIHYSQGSVAKNRRTFLSVRTAAFLEFYRALGESGHHAGSEGQEHFRCQVLPLHRYFTQHRRWKGMGALASGPERSQRTYRQIRELLKDKAGYPLSRCSA